MSLFINHWKRGGRSATGHPRATLSVWLPKKGVLLGFHTIDESSWLDLFAGQLLAPTGGMTDDRFELEGEGTAREGELEPKNRTPTNGKHVR